MRRFKMHGGNFEPVRAKSATIRKASQKVPTRPHTAFVKRESQKDFVQTEEDRGAPELRRASSATKQSALMSVEKAKELEKKLAKAMDSKEAMMKLLEDNTELGSHLQHGVKLDELQDKETFMKTGILSTMTSADIVRKAKALADTYADKWKDRTDQEGEEQWDTILHAENKQAKLLISANRMRLRDLKRRMVALQKKREKLGLTRYDPDSEATDVKREDQKS